MRERPAVPDYSRCLRDRAALLIAAGKAAESLEQRCADASGPTITLSRDEALELAEQFATVTSLLTVVHLSEAQAAKDRATERNVA